MIRRSNDKRWRFELVLDFSTNKWDTNAIVDTINLVELQPRISIDHDIVNSPTPSNAVFYLRLLVEIQPCRDHFNNDRCNLTLVFPFWLYSFASRILFVWIAQFEFNDPLYINWPWKLKIKIIVKILDSNVRITIIWLNNFSICLHFVWFFIAKNVVNFFY